MTNYMDFNRLNNEEFGINGLFNIKIFYYLTKCTCNPLDSLLEDSEDIIFVDDGILKAIELQDLATEFRHENFLAFLECCWDENTISL